MILYHGTTVRRWFSIQSTGTLDPAPQGDQHVSFTSDKAVAAYFAQIAWLCTDEDEIGVIILETHKGALARHGLIAEPFSSEAWGVGECDWEKEWTVAGAVPSRLLSVHSTFGPISRPRKLGG